MLQLLTTLNKNEKLSLILNGWQNDSNLIKDWSEKENCNQIESYWQTLQKLNKIIKGSKLERIKLPHGVSPPSPDDTCCAAVEFKFNNETLIKSVGFGQSEEAALNSACKKMFDIFKYFY